MNQFTSKMLLDKQSVNKFMHKKLREQRDVFLEFLRSVLLCFWIQRFPFIEEREIVTVVR